MLSFWLSNTCHFLNCLKQYSGEEVGRWPALCSVLTAPDLTVAVRNWDIQLQGQPVPRLAY